MKSHEQRVLDEFLEDEKTKGRKEREAALRYRIGKLYTYLEERGLAFHEVRVKEAQAYQGWLLERGREDGKKYSEGTVMNFMKKATVFFDFLKRKGLVYANPFKDTRKVRVPRKIPRHVLKEKEMDELLFRLSCFDEGAGLKERMRRYRVHVAAEVMYAGGLRVAEAAGLRVEDIDFERQSIEVKEGKGGTGREVFLNEYAGKVLKLYTEKVRPLLLREYSRKNLLFGVTGSTLLLTMNRELKKATHTLGLPTMTSHGFRHALGFHLLRAGCDIRVIQEILGHRNIRNTEIYTRVDKEDLREVLDTYHPRKFKRIQHETSEQMVCR